MKSVTSWEEFSPSQRSPAFQNDPCSRSAARLQSLYLEPPGKEERVWKEMVWKALMSVKQVSSLTPAISMMICSVISRSVLSLAALWRYVMAFLRSPSDTRTRASMPFTKLHLWSILIAVCETKVLFHLCLIWLFIKKLWSKKTQNRPLIHNHLVMEQTQAWPSPLYCTADFLSHRFVADVPVECHWPEV